MNPDHPNSDAEISPAPAPPESGCGILPQSPQEATPARHGSNEHANSGVSTPASSTAPPPPTRSFDPDAYNFHMALELTRPEETYAEPDYDYEEDARERELLLDDLASDSDDFTRSDEEGWFYSDED